MAKTIHSKKMDDLAFGFIQEEKVLPILKDYFKNDNIEKTKIKNDVFDYTCDGIKIELKSRRINHNKYGSLIFGKNKYDKGLEYISNNEKVYFIFNCLDGIFLWEQNLQQSPHFAKGGRFDRGRPEVQELAHIPIDWSSKIH